jgi:hypothetical protein
MNSLIAVLRELAGLFVDDGSLALQILGVIVLASASSILLPDIPLTAGIILLFGCLGALFVNVTKIGRSKL